MFHDPILEALLVEDMIACTHLSDHVGGRKDLKTD